VIGKADIMNQYGPGEMTSTHTGNPICAAAALANLKLLVDEKLVENAAHRGETLLAGLEKVRQKYPDRIGPIRGKGLVAAFFCVQSGTKEPDPETAFAVVKNAMECGLLMFSPVGQGGGTVKICPPLCVTEEELLDGLAAFEQAVDRAMAS
jgi:4-aminobutyrate aminotransferase-like enzyme